MFCDNAEKKFISYKSLIKIQVNQVQLIFRYKAIIDVAF